MHMDAGLNYWLGRLDSNLGMAESKSAALPLGYAPTGGSLPPWRADHSGEAWTDQRPLTAPPACSFDGSAVELSPSWRWRQWARGTNRKAREAGISAAGCSIFVTAPRPGSSIRPWRPDRLARGRSPDWSGISPLSPRLRAIAAIRTSASFKSTRAPSGTRCRNWILAWT
jgi:hypothetical protein